MIQQRLQVSRWPRDGKYKGLAYGWPGPAWVWLNCVKGALLADNPRTRQAILRRLKQSEAMDLPEISHLIGYGAFPVVAALAATTDPEFVAPFHRTLLNWISQCKRSEETDMMRGAAGALLACAEIERLIPGKLPPNFLRNLQNKTLFGLAKLHSELKQGRSVLIGFSHGLAGYLFALEVGHVVFGLPFRADLRRSCLDSVAKERIAMIGKRAAVWPKRTGEKAIFYHSWCHGAPGIGLAFLCAYKLTGFRAYRNLGLLALRGAFHLRSRFNTFCCGSTGCAQILIEAYRMSGNRLWLRNARTIAARQSSQSFSGRYSKCFHHGRLGHLYLLWRLRKPNALPLLGLRPYSVSVDSKMAKG